MGLGTGIKAKCFSWARKVRGKSRKLSDFLLGASEPDMNEYIVFIIDDGYVDYRFMTVDEAESKGYMIEGHYKNVAFFFKDVADEVKFEAVKHSFNENENVITNLDDAREAKVGGLKGVSYLSTDYVTTRMEANQVQQLLDTKPKSSALADLAGDKMIWIIVLVVVGIAMIAQYM